jgi:hypothetical protein
VGLRSGLFFCAVLFAGCSLASLDDTTGGGDGTTASAQIGCPGCVTVAERQDQPTELVAVGDSFYFARGGTTGGISQVELDGGGPPVDMGSADSPHDLVYDGYPWAVSNGAIGRFRLGSSCNNAPEDVARLARYGDKFVIARANAIDHGYCGEGFTTVVPEHARALVGEPPVIWYATQDGDVKRVEEGGEPGTVARAQGLVETVAIDTTRIFWADTSATAQIKTKYKTDTTDAEPVVLAKDQKFPKTIVAAGSRLYWTNLEGGTVTSVAIAGGEEPTVVASDLDRPWGLAVTTQYIYVVESGAGRIRRLQR